MNAFSNNLEPLADEKIHVLEIQKLVRAEGYRLPGYEVFAAKVMRNGFLGVGFGEGISEVAKAKALSEAYERCVLEEFASTHNVLETSNGWSCHFSSKTAIQNGILELIERDVALWAWQRGGPYYELPKSLWPDVLHAWQEDHKKTRPEFFNLRILLSCNENGACISALLFNERRNFVAGHASGLELERTILSAIKECLRAAHAAIRFEHFAEVKRLHQGGTFAVQPGAHSVAYAYTATFPNTVQIIPASQRAILKIWDRHNTAFQNLNSSEFRINLFHFGDRVVARVKSDSLQEIFWGKDPRGSKHKNNNPHIVG